VAVHLQYLLILVAALVAHPGLKIILCEWCAYVHRRMGSDGWANLRPDYANLGLNGSVIIATWAVGTYAGAVCQANSPYRSYTEGKEIPEVWTIPIFLVILGLFLAVLLLRYVYVDRKARTTPYFAAFIVGGYVLAAGMMWFTLLLALPPS